MSPRPHVERAEEPSALSTPGSLDDPKELERLRQLLSCFGHRCRNSLNGIKMGLYLVRRESKAGDHGRCNDLTQIYEEIERRLDRLQVIYRPICVNMIRSPVVICTMDKMA